MHYLTRKKTLYLMHETTIIDTANITPTQKIELT